MLKAAIIGYGNIGPNHAGGVSDTEYGELYAICDIQKERADRAANFYNCKAYYDYEDVLKDADVDVVHICTPHYLHKDMAIAALSAGKHVVLEKPLALNREELEELIAAEQASDKKVCVMFQNRKNHAILKFKELVEKEAYGKLLSISGFMTWLRDEAYYKADAWRGKWETEGGGALINQAVHLLDMMTFIGGKVESVKANISTKLLGDIIEVEDTADALFFYESGIRGCFYATNAYGTTTPFQMIAEFENGRLRYSDNFLMEIVGNEPPKVIAGNDFNAPGKACWGSGHAVVIDEFYRAICENTDEYLALSQGVHTETLLCAIYESAKNNGAQTTL